MRLEPVEIYSDAANAAVMRHPARHFPGILIQGDSLYNMCQLADHACAGVGRGANGWDDLNEIRSALWSYLTHYKATLARHDLPLPFSEQQIP